MTAYRDTPTEDEKVKTKPALEKARELAANNNKFIKTVLSIVDRWEKFAINHADSVVDTPWEIRFAWEENNAEEVDAAVAIMRNRGWVVETEKRSGGYTRSVYFNVRLNWKPRRSWLSKFFWRKNR